MTHPRIIGKYRLQKILGEGAMGTVYHGFDPDIERHVAIKTLHSSLSEGYSAQQYLERFRREAQIAAQCVHPNIVMVLEYGRHEDMPYIVMEYVEGMSLSQLLKRHHKFSIKNTMSVATAVLSALSAAAKLGIVHRDIKPANIMVTNQGVVKLADFGIARISQNDEMTAVGAVLGTPKYMSPEQMAGAATDTRSDLYSLGLVLIDMLAQAGLAPNISLMKLTSLDASIVKKMGAQKHIPTAFVPFLEQALKHDPKRRFETPEAFSKALQLAFNQSKRQRRQSHQARHYEATQPDSYAEYTMVGVHRGQTDTAAHFIHIDEPTIAGITKDLNKYLGKQAPTVVHDELKQALSLAEMIRILALHIPKPKARQLFVERWTQ